MVEELIAFVQHHPYVIATALLVGYFVFTAAVNALLPPEPGKERTFYGFAFRFLSGIASTATVVAAQRFPNFVHVPSPSLGHSDNRPQLVAAGERTVTERTDFAVSTTK